MNRLLRPVDRLKNPYLLILPLLNHNKSKLKVISKFTSLLNLNYQITTPKSYYSSIRSKTRFHIDDYFTNFHTQNVVNFFHTSSKDLSNDEHESVAYKSTGKEYTKGPDQLIPSKALYSWHPDGAVAIKMGKGDVSEKEPISVPSQVKRNADKNPDAFAIMTKEDDKWKKWTYAEYLDDCRTVAKGFIALGLERFHSVCIIGINSPEWFLSDMGAIFAGGFAVGMYTTNSAEACAFCGLDSRANIFVVEDEVQLQKILSVRSKLPNLRAIVQYSGKVSEKGVISWADLIKLGKNQPDELLNDRLKRIGVNQCCTIIYTSGTTGNPKGVMLSHDSLTWMGHCNESWGNFGQKSPSFQEIIVSFLPLSHVAAQMSDIYCPLAVSGLVAFADKNALKGSLVENLKDVRPTKFLAVPRVWEKIHEKIVDIGRSTTGVKRKIADWAKSEAMECNLKRMNGDTNPETMGFKIANALVLKKIQEALGLDRCNLYLSGAAPISPDILRFFLALNIIVTEAYGMSECSGPHTMATQSAFRIGSVGQTMRGCSSKIAFPDKDGIGEICMQGRHVTMGYLNQPEKTRGALDEEGWLHSEDMGKIDGDGYLFITGRLKELLITAGGENVAPVPIEDTIKSVIPAISQAVVLGNKLKFLSVLLTIKTEVDPNSQVPLDKLVPVSKEWIEKNGNCSVNTIQDVMRELNDKKNKNLIKAIDDAIIKVNKLTAANHAQSVKKWVVLPTDFSIPGGEIGPSLKLKRNVVYEKYQKVIDEIYKIK